MLFDIEFVAFQLNPIHVAEGHGSRGWSVLIKNMQFKADVSLRSWLKKKHFAVLKRILDHNWLHMCFSVKDITHTQYLSSSYCIYTDVSSVSTSSWSGYSRSLTMRREYAQGGPPVHPHTLLMKRLALKLTFTF